MSDESLWWVALGVGLAVAVVAVALLQVLLGQVRRIERASAAIWETGKGVAGNTVTTWLVSAVADDMAALEAEVGRHGEKWGATPRRTSS